VFSMCQTNENFQKAEFTTRRIIFGK